MEVLSAEVGPTPGAHHGRSGGGGPVRRARARRKAGVPVDRSVLAAAQGHYRGLRLPGPPLEAARWHPRLDVLVTAGELWVTGNGETRCYPVAAMVLASFATSPQGAVRVDFLDGPPLCVTLDDNGAVLDALRHEIWEYEKGLSFDGTELDWALDVSPVQLAESESLLTAALEPPGEQDGRGLTRLERQEMMRRSAELRRDARVDALRRRRRRMLGRPVPDSGDAVEA